MIASPSNVDPTDRELRALRLLALDSTARLDETLLETLLTKGLLRASWDHSPSPAGHHALVRQSRGGPLAQNA